MKKLVPQLLFLLFFVTSICLVQAGQVDLKRFTDNDFDSFDKIDSFVGSLCAIYQCTTETELKEITPKLREIFTTKIEALCNKLSDTSARKRFIDPKSSSRSFQTRTIEYLSYIIQQGNIHSFIHMRCMCNILHRALPGYFQENADTIFAYTHVAMLSQTVGESSLSHFQTLWEKFKKHFYNQELEHVDTVSALHASPEVIKKMKMLSDSVKIDLSRLERTYSKENADHSSDDTSHLDSDSDDTSHLYSDSDEGSATFPQDEQTQNDDIQQKQDPSFNTLCGEKDNQCLLEKVSIIGESGSTEQTPKENSASENGLCDDLSEDSLSSEEEEQQEMILEPNPNEKPEKTLFTYETLEQEGLNIPAVEKESASWEVQHFAAVVTATLIGTIAGVAVEHYFELTRKIKRLFKREKEQNSTP